MLTKLTSFTTLGLSSERITVEVASSPGEGDITIVGLGDTAVQESKQRVRMALRSCGYRLLTGRHITINLAPADVKKIGPRFDLPIAVGLLLVHGLIDVTDEHLKTLAFLGELSLDGTLRHVSGVLPAALACRDARIASFVVPSIDGSEAGLVTGVQPIAVSHLKELIEILCNGAAVPPVPPMEEQPESHQTIDFADIRGQLLAKRAMEIAAAGGHNVLLCGAPGAGKTLLAKALRGILPPMSLDEALDITRIYSVANLLRCGSPLLRERPFRTVHHTASGVSIVGGGQIPGPGEVSLAHRGVLFLDELAEFPPAVLEVLRQPLEERTITITRAQGSVTFPADVLLVAAMNPPQEGSPRNERIKRRISAPFLDRIDLTIAVQSVPVEELAQKIPQEGEGSAVIRARVVAARERQRARFAGMPLTTNKEMGIRELREYCALDATAETLLQTAAQKLHLSARSYHRTLKVARTIADLAGNDRIDRTHLAEAFQYRQPLSFDS
jgi:magnesium chelatase family protein